MRWEIVCAAALTAISTTAAQAEGWCGYAARQKAVIECGYSTAAQCENAIGKGGMCFIDPDYASNVWRVTPKLATRGDGPPQVAGQRTGIQARVQASTKVRGLSFERVLLTVSMRI